MTVFQIVAERLKTHALVQFPDLADARVCITPGSQYAWDACDCGSIGIYVTRLYHSDVWPPSEVTDAQNCPPRFVVVDYSVVVLRCTPGPDSQGRPPACDKLESSAFQIFTDIGLLRTAVSDAVNSLIDDEIILEYALRGQDLVGPQGLCAGSKYDLSVGVHNDWRDCVG